MACAGGEPRSITEWLLYHRAIGFDHVYLYCDDDDPAHLYGQVLPFLQAAPPFVTFVRFPYQGQQFYMHRHFLEHRKHQAAWIAFLDVDEFLCLPGLDDIRRYLAGCPPEWDAIHVNRNEFATGGQAGPPRGSVLTACTQRDRTLSRVTRTLTRSACIDLARIDRKHEFWRDWGDMLPPEAIAVNVLGDPMRRVAGDPDYLSAAEVQARMRARAVINRYAGQSGDDQVPDTYLADYWRRFLSAADAASIAPRSRKPNVALGKPARQSSISEWSLGATVEADAAGAVSGLITGRYQFHTGFEDAPWWQVDLGAPHALTDIHLYNRVDHPDYRLRLGRFVLQCSLDGDGWRPVYLHDGRPVGGADGNPLVLRLAESASEPRVCRYLRITALQPTWLHLDQVAVCGEEWRDSPAPPAAAREGPQDTTAALDALIALLGDPSD